MNKYLKIVIRFALIFVAIFLITTLVFFAMQLIPGGPFNSEKAVTPEVRATLMAKYGNGKSVGEQYSIYLEDIFLHFDFGPSLKLKGWDVSDVISTGLSSDLTICLSAIVFGFLFGIPWGVLCGNYYKKNNYGKFLKHANSLMLCFSAIFPLLATLALFICCVKFSWFPANGSSANGIILPIICLALLVGSITSANISTDIINNNCASDDQAKGIGNMTTARIIVKALAKALGMFGPLLLCGAVIEQIFAVPGVGRTFVQSIINRDYSLIMGIVIVFSALTLIANFVSDAIRILFVDDVELNVDGKRNGKVLLLGLHQNSLSLFINTDNYRVMFDKNFISSNCYNKKSNTSKFITTLAVIVFVVLIVSCIIIPEVWPYAYEEQLGIRTTVVDGITVSLPTDSSYKNLKPFEYGKTEKEQIAAGEDVFPHVFGTDSVGRDYFVRVVCGMRTTLIAAAVSVAISVLLGALYGMLSGFIKKKFDKVFMGLCDVLNGFLPLPLLPLVIIAIENNSNSFIQSIGGSIAIVVLLLGICGSLGFARIIRSYIISKSSGNAVAGSLFARTFITAILSQILLFIAGETLLSFVGLGIATPSASLGSLISDAMSMLYSYAYRSMIPSAILFVVVFVINLIKNGIQDSRISKFDI